MTDIKLNIEFNKIQINSFNLNIPTKSNFKKDSKLFKFQYNIKTKVEPAKELFLVDLNISILYGRTKTEICSLKTYFEYHVLGLEKILIKKNKKIGIPDHIPTLLIVNAVSTCRGILFHKTAGTPIENIYLPIISPDKFLSSQSKGKLPKK